MTDGGRSMTAPGAELSPPSQAEVLPVVALGLGALALAGGHLGPIADSTGRAGAAGCLLLVAAASLLGGPRPHLVRRLLVTLLLSLGAVLVVTRAAGPEGPVLGASLALLAMARAARGLGRPHHEARLGALALAGVVLSAFELLTLRWAAAWRAVEAATRSVTGSLGQLAGSETSLGPSVAGVPLVVLVLAYLGFRALLGARRAPALLALAAAWVLALTGAAWALGMPVFLRLFLAASQSLSLTPEETVPRFPASVAVFFPVVLLGLHLIPALAFEARRAPAAPARPGRPLPAAALVAAAALLAFALGLPAIRTAVPGAAPPRVTFLDRGMVSWAVPVPSRLGLEQVGMFGMLPRYLEGAGFEVRLDRDALEQASVEASDVIVIINPTEAIPAEARERLRRFVAAGGGLLVLGDHTDIEGSMGHLNELLEPYGIAFLFDSAFTPNRWRYNAGFFPGPLTRNLDGANSRFQQSTGASLSLGRGAAPVAMARWGFSDAGDRENVENAFLGDYIYQASEPLGDLPVVAMSRHGRGRVIVFGDTSAFQNIALPFAWPFLSRVFLTAAGDRIAVLEWIRGAGLLGILLLGGWIVVRRREPELIALLVGVLLGLPGGGIVAGRLERDAPPARHRLAVVDGAHFNGVSLGIWSEHGLSGVNMNLARNGLLPVVDREGSLLEARPRLFVSIAPRRAFSAAEIRALRAMMEEGGDVILAVGYEEKEASASLLEEMGFDIEPVPLGPVPILRKIADDELFRRLQLEPHFAEAWPVAGVDPARDQVLYGEGAFPIVVRRPVGSGAFTLIADTQFLQSRIIEEEGAAWRGNVAFLRRLFLRDGAPPVGAGP